MMFDTLLRTGIRNAGATGGMGISWKAASSGKHLPDPVPERMAGSQLIMPASRDCGAFLLMVQVIVYLIQQVILAFIIDEVFPRYKFIQEIRLKIREQETAASHNIKGAERNTASDAPQGNIQVNSALFKNIRHLPIVIYGTMIAEMIRHESSIVCKKDPVCGGEVTA